MKVEKAALVIALAVIGVAGVGGLLRAGGRDVTRPATISSARITARPAPEAPPPSAVPRLGDADISPSARDVSLIEADEVTWRATLEPRIEGLEVQESTGAGVETADDADEITRLATLEPVLEPD